LKYRNEIIAWNLPIHDSNGLEKKMKLLHVDLDKNLKKLEWWWCSARERKKRGCKHQ
jgi:hypothetical protein